MTVHAEYLVDEKGIKKSVVLSIQDYVKLWEYLEDMEDAVDLKKAKETAHGFIDFGPQEEIAGIEILDASNLMWVGLNCYLWKGFSP